MRGLVALPAIFAAIVAANVGAAPAVQPQPGPATDRPVVLVHGLASSADTWQAYLGEDGFLAQVGRVGFAVGDGQAPGELRTGSLLDPYARTRTIAENAAQLRDYLAGVREQTGADQVDLVAHSMGGLIARYYIDVLMDDRDVHQLIMLGVPNGGSACAILPARLGIGAPATVELRPGYVREVFNRQVTRTRGVPFHILAGTPINDRLRAPCTDVPTDLVVSQDSVEALGITASEAPVAHTDLPGSERAFEDFVAPLLAADVPAATPSGEVAAATDELQFVPVADGRVTPGGAADETIHLDEGVAVASFALYDPTQSLEVTIRGASGNVIDLDPAGLVVVDDPATLVHLGYGLENPAPGPWQVTLRATDRTPSAGAEYAVTAQVHGGATLVARVSELVPTLGQEVTVTATLEQGGVHVPADQAYVLVRDPHGQERTVPLEPAGERGLAGTWRPTLPGLHSLDVVVTGRAGAAVVERAAFLAADVQPAAGAAGRGVLLVAGLVLTALLMLGALVLLSRHSERRRRAAAAGSDQPAMT